MMQGKNQKDLKEENSSVIIRLIREEANISRADIVRKTGLTPPTVSRIVSTFIRRGLVKESLYNTNSVGRKPLSLTFNGNNLYVLSVEISYQYLNISVVSLAGRIIQSVHVQTTTAISEKGLLDLLFSKGKDLLKVYGEKQFIGVGITCPGMVDPETRTLIKIPNLHNISNFGIGEAVQKEIRLPVLVANDANGEALGEKYFGAGDVKDFVLLHLGYGIGAGIVLNNKLYQGNFGVSGEVGHISVSNSKANKCDCGNYGCVELFGGMNSLIKECSEVLPSIKSIEDVKTFAGRDERIRQIIYEHAELIGNVLVSVVNILSPQKIVVSGPQSILGDFLITPIKKVVDSRSFYSFGKKISIVQSNLRENEGIIGAMTVVLDSFLSNPHRFITL
ncbi:MAG: ROK family transcriptional regulator [Caldisericaceae bacterium]